MVCPLVTVQLTRWDTAAPHHVCTSRLCGLLRVHTQDSTLQTFGTELVKWVIFQVTFPGFKAPLPSSLSHIPVSYSLLREILLNMHQAKSRFMAKLLTLAVLADPRIDICHTSHSRCRVFGWP